MNTKILLVSPPFYKPYSEEVKADSAPLGLGYVASYALQQNPGISVKVVDFAARKYSPEAWRQELYDFRPDILGITILSLSYANAMSLAKLAKEGNSDLLVVAGGPHATLRSEECLLQSDIVVRGEGEQTFSEILQGRELGTIKGIYYTNNGEIIRNGARERFENLDSLPFPAHHLFDLEKYRGYPGWEIIGSRGCAYSCSFCAAPQLWGRHIVFRSPGNLVDEIEYLHKEMGINHINFQDDAINIPERRAIEICDEIIGRNLHKNMTFEGQVRANQKCVSPQVFRRMKEAGFVDISFGIESGSDKVLEYLNKSLTVAEARRAIKLARQAGIPTVTGFFMVGNWGETIWDILKTWYFVFTNNVDMKLTVCTPLPETGFYARLKQAGYLDKEVDWQKVTWVTPVTRTDKMPEWLIDLMYKLTVLLVHLPSSLLRGRRKKTLGLISNVAHYGLKKLKGVFR